MNALIVYHTVTGHTKRAAEDIAEGLRSGGVAVRLEAVSEARELNVADQSIVVVGSPCHAGSLAIQAGVSGPIRSFLRQWADSVLTGKVGGAFAVHSTYGGHRTVRGIERRLRKAGARIPEAGVVVRAGVPFSLFTGPMASEECQEKLRAFGRALALAAEGGCGQGE